VVLGRAFAGTVRRRDSRSGERVDHLTPGWCVRALTPQCRST